MCIIVIYRVWDSHIVCNASYLIGIKFKYFFFLIGPQKHLERGFKNLSNPKITDPDKKVRLL